MPEPRKTRKVSATSSKKPKEKVVKGAVKSTKNQEQVNELASTAAEVAKVADVAEVTEVEASDSSDSSDFSDSPSSSSSSSSAVKATQSSPSNATSEDDIESIRNLASTLREKNDLQIPFDEDSGGVKIKEVSDGDIRFNPTNIALATRQVFNQVGINTPKWLSDIVHITDQNDKRVPHLVVRDPNGKQLNLNEILPELDLCSPNLRSFLENLYLSGVEGVIDQVTNLKMLEQIGGAFAPFYQEGVVARNKKDLEAAKDNPNHYTFEEYKDIEQLHPLDYVERMIESARSDYEYSDELIDRLCEFFFNLPDARKICLHDDLNVPEYKEVVEQLFESEAAQVDENSLFHYLWTNSGIDEYHQVKSLLELDLNDDLDQRTFTIWTMHALIQVLYQYEDEIGAFFYSHELRTGRAIDLETPKFNQLIYLYYVRAQLTQDIKHYQEYERLVKLQNFVALYKIFVHSYTHLSDLGIAAQYDSNHYDSPLADSYIHSALLEQDFESFISKIQISANLEHFCKNDELCQLAYRLQIRKDEITSFFKTRDINVFCKCSELEKRIVAAQSESDIPLRYTCSSSNRIAQDFKLTQIHFCYLEPLLKLHVSHYSNDVIATIEHLSQLNQEKVKTNYQSHQYSFGFVPRLKAFILGYITKLVGMAVANNTYEMLMNKETSSMCLYDIFLNEDKIQSSPKINDFAEIIEDLGPSLKESISDNTYSMEMFCAAIHIAMHRHLHGLVYQNLEDLYLEGSGFADSLNHTFKYTFTEILCGYSEFILSHLYEICPNYKAAFEYYETFFDWYAITGTPSHEAQGYKLLQDMFAEVLPDELALMRSPLYQLGLKGIFPVMPGTSALTASMIGRGYTYGELLPMQQSMGYSSLRYADGLGNGLASTYLYFNYLPLFNIGLFNGEQMFIMQHMRALRAFDLCEANSQLVRNFEQWDSFKYLRLFDSPCDVKNCELHNYAFMRALASDKYKKCYPADTANLERDTNNQINITGRNIRGLNVPLSEIYYGDLNNVYSKAKETTYPPIFEGEIENAKHDSMFDKNLKGATPVFTVTKHNFDPSYNEITKEAVMKSAYAPSSMAEANKMSSPPEIVVSPIEFIKDLIERNPGLDLSSPYEGIQREGELLQHTILGNTLIFMVDYIDRNIGQSDRYLPVIEELLDRTMNALLKDYAPTLCLAYYRFLVSPFCTKDQSDASRITRFLKPIQLNRMVIRQLFGDVELPPEQCFKIIKTRGHILEIAAIFLDLGLQNITNREQGLALIDNIMASSHLGQFAPIVQPYLDEYYRSAAALGMGNSIGYLASAKRVFGEDEYAQLLELVGGKFYSHKHYRAVARYFEQHHLDQDRYNLAIDMILQRHPYGFFEGYLCLRNGERKREAHTLLYYAASMNVPEAVAELEVLEASKTFEPLPFVIYLRYLEELAKTNIQALLTLFDFILYGDIVPRNYARLIALLDRYHNTYSNSTIKNYLMESGLVNFAQLNKTSNSEWSHFFLTEEEYQRINVEAISGSSVKYQNLVEVLNLLEDGFINRGLTDPQVKSVVTKLGERLASGTTMIEDSVFNNWRQGGSYPNFLQVDNLRRVSFDDFEEQRFSMDMCSQVAASFSNTLYVQFSLHEALCNADITHPYKVEPERFFLSSSMTGVSDFQGTLQGLKAAALMSLRYQGRPQPESFSKICRYLGNMGNTDGARLSLLNTNYLMVEPYGDAYIDEVISPLHQEVEESALFFNSRLYDHFASGKTPLMYLVKWGLLLLTLQNEKKRRASNLPVECLITIAGKGENMDLVQMIRYFMNQENTRKKEEPQQGASVIVESGVLNSLPPETRERYREFQEKTMELLARAMEKEEGDDFDLGAEYKRLVANTDTDIVAISDRAREQYLEEYKQAMDAAFYHVDAAQVIDYNLGDLAMLLCDDLYSDALDYCEYRFSGSFRSKFKLDTKQDRSKLVRYYLQAFARYAYFMNAMGLTAWDAIVLARNPWQMHTHPLAHQRSYSSILAKLVLTQSDVTSMAMYRYYTENHYFKYAFNDEQFIGGDNSNTATARKFVREVLQIDPKSENFEQFAQQMSEEGFTEFEQILHEEQNGYVPGRYRFITGKHDYDPDLCCTIYPQDIESDCEEYNFEEELPNARRLLVAISKRLNHLDRMDPLNRWSYFAYVMPHLESVTANGETIFFAKRCTDCSPSSIRTAQEMILKILGADNLALYCAKSDLSPWLKFIFDDGKHQVDIHSWIHQMSYTPSMLPYRMLGMLTPSEVQGVVNFENELLHAAQATDNATLRTICSLDDSELKAIKAIMTGSLWGVPYDERNAMWQSEASECALAVERVYSRYLDELKPLKHFENIYEIASYQVDSLRYHLHQSGAVKVVVDQGQVKTVIPDSFTKRLGLKFGISDLASQYFMDGESAIPSFDEGADQHQLGFDLAEYVTNPMGEQEQTSARVDDDAIEEEKLLACILNNQPYQGKLFSYNVVNDIEQRINDSEGHQNSHIVNKLNNLIATLPSNSGESDPMSLVTLHAEEAPSDGHKINTAKMFSQKQNVVNNTNEVDIFSRLSSFLGENLGNKSDEESELFSGLITKALAASNKKKTKKRKDKMDFDCPEDPSDELTVEQLHELMNKQGEVRDELDEPNNLISYLIKSGWQFDRKSEQQFIRPHCFYEVESPLHTYAYAFLRNLSDSLWMNFAAPGLSVAMTCLYKRGYFFGSSDIVDNGFSWLVVTAANKNRLRNWYSLPQMIDMHFKMHRNDGPEEIKKFVEHVQYSDFNGRYLDEIRKDADNYQGAIAGSKIALNMGDAISDGFYRKQPYVQSLLYSTARQVQRQPLVFLDNRYMHPAMHDLFCDFWVLGHSQTVWDSYFKYARAAQWGLCCEMVKHLTIRVSANSGTVVDQELLRHLKDDIDFVKKHNLSFYESPIELAMSKNMQCFLYDRISRTKPFLSQYALELLSSRKKPDFPTQGMLNQLYYEGNVADKERLDLWESIEHQEEIGCLDPKGWPIKYYQEYVLYHHEKQDGFYTCTCPLTLAMLMEDFKDTLHYVFDSNRRITVGMMRDLLLLMSGCSSEDKLKCLDLDVDENVGEDLL